MDFIQTAINPVTEQHAARLTANPAKPRKKAPSPSIESFPESIEFEARASAPQIQNDARASEKQQASRCPSVATFSAPCKRYAMRGHGYFYQPNPGYG